MQFSAELEVSPSELGGIIHEAIEDEITIIVRDIAQDICYGVIKKVLDGGAIEKIAKNAVAGIAKDVMFSWHRESFWKEFQGTGMSRPVFDALFDSATRSEK